MEMTSYLSSLKMGANATIHVAFLCHPQETKWENFHNFGNKFQIVTLLSCQIPLLHCLAFNFYEIGNDSDEGTHSLYLTLSKVQISAKAQCVWIARGCLDPLGERAGSFILTHLRERSWVASLLLVAAPCPHHLKGQSRQCQPAPPLNLPLPLVSMVTNSI